MISFHMISELEVIELEKIKMANLAAEIKGRVMGWTERPGAYYLGRSCALPVLRSMSDFALEGRIAKNYYFEELHRLDWRIKQIAHIIVGYVPPSEGQNSHFTLEQVSLTHVSVDPLTLEQTIMQLSYSNGEYPNVSRTVEKRKLLFIFPRQKWSQDVASRMDLMEFDRLLEDPL